MTYRAIALSSETNSSCDWKKVESTSLSQSIGKFAGPEQALKLESHVKSTILRNVHRGHAGAYGTEWLT